MGPGWEEGKNRSEKGSQTNDSTGSNVPKIVGNPGTFEAFKCGKPLRISLNTAVLGGSVTYSV